MEERNKKRKIEEKEKFEKNESNLSKCLFGQKSIRFVLFSFFFLTKRLEG